MVSRPRILLVGNAGHARSLSDPLAAAGYEPILATGFISAKGQLDTRPELLITELKLGAYNGLHLAIRASTNRIPTIVIGDQDPVLEAEAVRQQALYLNPPVEADTVIEIVRKFLDRSAHTRRSTRRAVPGIRAFVNETPVRLCDVSYEGMRIESQEWQGPPPYFDVRLPQFKFSCRAQRVWTAAVAEDHTRVWCGAALASSDRETAMMW